MICTYINCFFLIVGFNSILHVWLKNAIFGITTLTYELNYRCTNCLWKLSRNCKPSPSRPASCLITAWRYLAAVRIRRSWSLFLGIGFRTRCLHFVCCTKCILNSIILRREHLCSHLYHWAEQLQYPVELFQCRRQRWSSSSYCSAVYQWRYSVSINFIYTTAPRLHALYIGSGSISFFMESCIYIYIYMHVCMQTNFTYCNRYIASLKLSEAVHPPFLQCLELLYIVDAATDWFCHMYTDTTYNSSDRFALFTARSTADEKWTKLTRNLWHVLNTLRVAFFITILL